MDAMDQIYRFDLYISCNGSERVSSSPDFTMSDLADRTKDEVGKCRNFLRTKPAVFFQKTAVGGNIKQTVEAVLQTRPNGVVLFLITPEFFNERQCVAEFRAFLEVQSDSEVNLKLVLVYLGFDDGILSPLVEEQVQGQSYFAILTDIDVTSIQVTSASLRDVVFEAFDCSKNLSPRHLPTVLGRTRAVSFRALQRVFTNDFLPAFRAVLHVPNNVKHVSDAFIELRDRGTVTQHNVERLRDVIWDYDGTERDAQLRMVDAYELKWVRSHRLDWGVELLEKLSRRLEDNSNGTSQGSSSAQHQISHHITSDDKHETSKPVKFKPYFDTPRIISDVVLDFKSLDAKGYPVTTEALLLRKVLGMDGRSVSARGTQTNARNSTHGMGGVGKTTALRALCSEDDVKKAYFDGICFLEFGENASDAKLIKQVAQCVHNLGGEKEAKNMDPSGNLSDMLDIGAVWLRERTVLLVCDDLWRKRGNDYGYLDDVTNLLRLAPRSSLLISTRSREIALRADEIVEFTPLDVEGDKARKILLRDASRFGVIPNIQDPATEGFIQRILGICAGLPLALAIAGFGLGRALLDSRTNGVRLYCKELIQDVEILTDEKWEDYPGLAKVIDSSLRLCQEWGSSYNVKQRYGQNFNMVHMFKGLSVLERQMVIPTRALKHVWDTDDRCTNAVMVKFADCNLANRSDSGMWSGQDFGLRLHDLVLVRCQRIAGVELSKFHKRIVHSYGKTVGNDRSSAEGVEDEDGVQCRPWWHIDNDGYVIAHLSRHLFLGKLAPELRSLLRDIRWMIRQMKVGGSEALESDFEHLIGEAYTESDIRRVQKVLINRLPYTQERCKLLAMYACVHLSTKELNEPSDFSLFQIICHHLPKLWLLPATRYETSDSSLFQRFCPFLSNIWRLPSIRYVTPRDEQEEWKAFFEGGGGATPSDLILDRESGKVVVAHSESIVSWCTNRHRVFPKISYRVKCIAFSADGMLVVSGSDNGILQRWDAHSRAPIGEPHRVHNSAVTCVALSTDKELIVSGSDDGTLRRWYVQSGAPNVNPLLAHNGAVTCVALTANTKLIVSGSDDGTLQRWDAHTGSPIGDPLRGHDGAVTCVAPIGDGSSVVSGSDDGTLRRWDVQTGAPIGNPLRAHKGAVTCVAMNSDMWILVSGSDDGTFRLWDTHAWAHIGDTLRDRSGAVIWVALSADMK